MLCKRCGTENEDTEPYCQHCGSVLGEKGKTVALDSADLGGSFGARSSGQTVSLDALETGNPFGTGSTGYMTGGYTGTPEFEEIYGSSGADIYGTDPSANQRGRNSGSSRTIIVVAAIIGIAVLAIALIIFLFILSFQKKSHSRPFPGIPGKVVFFA